MPSVFARIALILVLVLATAPQASAAFVIIDNFTTPAVAQTVIIAPNPNPSGLSGLTGIGSTRTSTFAVNGTAGNFDLLVSQGGGNLNFNSGNGIRSTANLNYSSFTGGTNNFFNGGTPFSFLMNFAALDPGQNVIGGGNALNMPVDIAITTSNGTLSGSFLLGPTAVTQTYALPFSALTGGTIQDLANVISVNVLFNGDAGGNQRQAVDFVLTSVSIQVDAAPVPPTLFLGLAGIPLLRCLRRRA